MPCRQTLYYHRVRNQIFDVLGRICATPGCGATIDLEFDVIKPVGDPKSHHGKMSSSARAAFYKRQFNAGNLQVLCTKCNSSKRDRDCVQQPIPEMSPEEIAEYAH